MGCVVIDLPIEPIDTRYSAQWARWFEKAYQRHGVDYVSVWGTRTKKPDPDKFLDPFGTFEWKFSQLFNAVELIKKMSKETDKRKRFVVFLHDGWFPGIESFAYIRSLANVDIRVCGYFHAGSWDKSDLLGRAGCEWWATGSEESWLTICNRIFVGSEYHAKMIYLHRMGATKHKIVVTGCPIEIDDLGILTHSKREDVVVWPHRLSDDKNPEAVKLIERLLKQDKKYSHVKFIKTMEMNLHKSQYYRLLAKSKVALSTALHENFGIGMVEAATLGCYPICPDSLSYKETMEDFWRYGNVEQAVLMIKAALRQDEPYKYPYKEKYNQEVVTDKIVKSLIEVVND